MTKIIDGKLISQQIKEELKELVEKKKGEGKQAALAVIQVGNDPASSVYVGNKKKACAYIGIDSLSYELAKETTQEELLSLIDQLNADEKVTGILVQLPVPEQIDEDTIIKRISPKKDVDGFHPMSVGALCIGEKGFVSCTPAGRSNIVGKPMALLLLRENGTVTVAHSRTKNLTEVCKRADILVVAVGKPKMITREFVKEGAAVIDVGIHRMEDGKLCGDVDYEDVAPVCSAITPVPGGVGPMTIAMLMNNCVEAMDQPR